MPDSFPGVLLVSDEFFIQESVRRVVLRFVPGGFFVVELCVILLLILSVLVVPVLPGVSSVLGGHGGRRSRDSVWLGLLCVFVADGLVLVPSFDLVRLKGGRRIRCGLWLASSLRRGESFQSSPSVGFGFRLSVSPAAAEFLPVFTCCGDGRCAWEAIYSTSSPSSKSSSAVSTLWTSSFVQMAAISLVPAGGRDQGRWREDPGT